MNYLLCILSLFAQSPENKDPFRYLINVLYNPRFARKENLFQDPYSGPVPEENVEGPAPGWCFEGGATFTVRDRAEGAPNRSLELADIRKRSSFTSLRVKLREAKVVGASAKVLVEGDPSKARIKLIWHLRGGSRLESRSKPPQHAGKFEKVRAFAKAPENSVSVALALEALPGAQTCRFAAPLMAFASTNLRVFCFPPGYHPAGVREILIRSPLPLVRPWAKVSWEHNSEDFRVYPVRSHPSGYYYYACDIMALSEPGEYNFQILDRAPAGRSAKCSFEIEPDLYSEIAAAAQRSVTKGLTEEHAKASPLGKLSRQLVILGYLEGFTPRQLNRFTNIGSSFAKRTGPSAENLSELEKGFAAWALASLGQLGENKTFLSKAKQLVLPIWKQKQPKEPEILSSVGAAATIVASAEGDVTAREIADDMIHSLLRFEKKAGPSELMRSSGEHWPAVSFSLYAGLFPKSSLTEAVHSALSRFLRKADYLCADTPFGQAKVVLGENRAIEIPRWKRGNTLYLLSTACALLKAVETTGKGTPSRFCLHAERQIQFVLGYNPLGKKLDCAGPYALRSSSGERFRPGTVLKTKFKDKLSCRLYLAWSCFQLQTMLDKAKEYTGNPEKEGDRD